MREDYVHMFILFNWHDSRSAVFFFCVHSFVCLCVPCHFSFCLVLSIHANANKKANTKISKHTHTWREREERNCGTCVCVCVSICHLHFHRELELFAHTICTILVVYLCNITNSSEHLADKINGSICRTINLKSLKCVHLMLVLWAWKYYIHRPESKPLMINRTTCMLSFFLSSFCSFTPSLYFCRNSTHLFCFT